jgi:hypothetical protein
MSRFLRLAPLVALLLAACAGKPRLPDWQADAHDALEKYQKHYFEGRTAVAQRQLEQARLAVARSGRLDMAARTELYRCAIGTAAIDFDKCGEVQERLADATPEDRAYAAFLLGNWHEVDVKKLPSQYRAVVEAQSDAAQNKAIPRIEDPVSRLIAAGVLLKTARITPETVNVAVDTASAQGYRRPLLAWLNIQARFAQAANDIVSLEKIRRRIDFVAEPTERP